MFLFYSFFEFISDMDEVLFIVECIFELKFKFELVFLLKFLLTFALSETKLKFDDDKVPDLTVLIIF